MQRRAAGSVCKRAFSCLAAVLELQYVLGRAAPAKVVGAPARSGSCVLACELVSREGLSRCVY